MIIDSNTQVVMKKRLFLSALLALLAVPLWAASTVAEQLLDRFERTEGRERVEVANAFMKEMLKEEVTDTPLSFSSASPTDSLSMMVWYWAGEYLYAVQQYVRAGEYAKKALSVLKKRGDLQIQSDCLSLLGAIFFRLSDYVNASEYIKKCYAIDRKLGDLGRQSSSLNTIAAIYLASKQPEEAEKYILKAIEVNKQVDQPGRMAVLLGMASEVYNSMRKYALSLDYAQQAYELENKLGRTEKAAVRLTQMASAYIGMNRYDEAGQVLEKAMPVLRKSKNQQSLGISCNLMGKVRLYEHKEAEAVGFFTEGMEIFQQLGDLFNEIHSQEGLYKALKNSHPVQAMIHHERLTQLKDSVYNKETSKQLSKYNAEYSNEMLKAENQRHERFIRLMLIVGGALMLVLLIAVVWTALANRRRERQQLSRYDKLQGSMDMLNEKYEQLRNRYSNAMATRSAADDDEDMGLCAADRDFLVKTTRVVERQVELGQFDVDTVASQLNISPSQFRRRLSAVTGTSPQLFIQNIRMKKARFLLDNHPELNINEVAIKCGYEENSTFTRVFKRVFGITPSDYINGRIDNENDEETLT